jgi:predicted phage terminase large subunit-like protein
MDKVTRLNTQTNFFVDGQVILPRTAGWHDDYVHEITGFPGSRHDDQVDSTSQFLDHMRNQPRPMIISEAVLRRAMQRDPWNRS